MFVPRKCWDCMFCEGPEHSAMCIVSHLKVNSYIERLAVSWIKDVFTWFVQQCCRFIHVGLNKVGDCDIKSKTATDKEKKNLSTVKHARNINENSRKHKKTCMMWTNSFHDYLKHGHELPQGMIAMEYGGKVRYLNAHWSPSVNRVNLADQLLTIPSNSPPCFPRLIWSSLLTLVFLWIWYFL